MISYIRTICKLWLSSIALLFADEKWAEEAVFWNSVIRYFFVYRIEFGLNSNSVVSNSNAN